MNRIKNKIQSNFYIYFTVHVFLDLLTICGLFLIVFSILSILDSLFLLSRNGRWSSFILLLFLTAFSSLLYIIKHKNIFRMETYFSILENLKPHHHDFLKNTWFFLRERNKSDISQAISNELNKKASAFYKDFSFLKSISRPLSRNCLFLFISGLFAFMFFSFTYRQFSLYNQRIIQPWNDKLIPYNLDFTITPGDTSIIKNSSLTVSLTAKQKINDFFHIEFGYDQGDLINKEIMVPQKNNEYSYSFKNIERPMKYRISSSFYKSPLYEIKTIEHPRIVKVDFTLTPPLYTRLKQKKYQDGLTEFTALKGSTIEFQLTSSHHLKKAVLVSDDSMEIPLDMETNKVRGKITVNSDKKFYFSVQDANGLFNQEPIQYLINIQPDLYPMAKIIYPGKDLDISDESELPIQGIIADDFGLRKADLCYRVNDDKKTTRVPIPFEKGEKSQVVQMAWDIGSLRLFTDDKVSYYLEVEDNDSPNRYKKAKSRTYIIRIPSLFEIVEETDKQKKEEMANLEDSFKNLKEIDKKYEEIQREFKKNADLTKDKRQELMKQIEAAEKVTEKVQKSADQFQEIMKKIEKHQALTEQTMNKMKEVEKLMKELTPETLKKLREKLKNRMNDQSKNDLKENMEQLDEENKEFMKKLERTIALLKKLQAEEKLSQMTKKIEKIEKEQKKIEDQMNKGNKENQESSRSEKKPSSSKKNNEEILKKEDKLKKELEQLEQDMEDFKKLMKEAKSKHTPRANELSEQSKKMNLPEQMRETMKSAKENKSQKAKKQSKQMRQDMKKLQKAMEDTRKEMEMEELTRLIEKMKELYQNILYTSRDQEKIASDTRNASLNDSHLSELTEKQQEVFNTIQETADSLVEYSKARSEITQQSLSLLGQAMINMKSASEGMISARNYEPGKNNHREFSQAQSSQSSALGYLNQSAYQIYNDLQSMKQSKKSCSNPMPMPMAGMKQMSKQQKQVNQAMGQMMGQMKNHSQSGKMSKQQSDRMKQLALQQAQIAKQLEEYLREQKNKSKSQQPLGRLDKTVEDMIKTAEELENNILNEKTQERNKNILSRLLDSEKSLREREYSKKRKARSGKNFKTLSPEELKENILYDNDLKKVMILDAFKDKYPKNYEKLVRDYMDSLLKHENDKKKEEK